jgi:hypothetical protein
VKNRGKLTSQGTANNISVKFDYRTNCEVVTVKVAEEWLIDSSKAHAVELGLESSVFSLDMSPEGFDSTFDYALLRLASPVGRERILSIGYQPQAQGSIVPHGISTSFRLPHAHRAGFLAAVVAAAN